MNKLSRHSLSTRRLRSIQLSLLLASIVQANAWAAENLEKIYIDADYMQLNLDTGYSVYTGNVNIKQGELKLTGDKVTIQQNKEDVERITVTGKPAHYNHVSEKGENIQAESEQMVYTASESKLVMTGNANLKQPDHQVSSQKIVYDTQKNIVIAGDKGEKPASGPDESQRVNITLTPKKDPAK